jgi:hypothetical protein
MGECRVSPAPKAAGSSPAGRIQQQGTGNSLPDPMNPTCAAPTYSRSFALTRTRTRCLFLSPLPSFLLPQTCHAVSNEVARSAALPVNPAARRSARLALRPSRTEGSALGRVAPRRIGAVWILRVRRRYRHRVFGGAGGEGLHHQFVEVQRQLRHGEDLLLLRFASVASPLSARSAAAPPRQASVR